MNQAIRRIISLTVIHCIVFGVPPVENRPIRMISMYSLVSSPKTFDSSLGMAVSIFCIQLILMPDTAVFFKLPIFETFSRSKQYISIPSPLFVGC